VDGHDISALRTVFNEAKRNRNGKPKCIMAETIKGKGVSFMEGNSSWHGAHFDDADYERIISELKNSMAYADKE